MRRCFVLVVALLAIRVQLAVASDPLLPGLDEGMVDPDPSPYVVPSGLYKVTEVYTGNAVTTSGSTTTYTTTTTHEQPGTYARPVDTVGTGEASAYDGRSFNGRARLADGRLVAGTYYEDYVLTSAGYVLVNIVFFQDDSVTVAAETPPPPPAPTPAPTTVAATPRASATPVASAAPVPTRAPVPTAVPRPTAAPVSVPTPPAVVATAGVALSATAPTVGSIEILRGRLVHLWPRAFRDGVAVPVRSWRLVSGTVDLATPSSGGGGQPCDAMWLVPSTVAPFTLRFEVTSDALPGRVMTATIAVTVRSPALLQ